MPKKDTHWLKKYPYCPECGNQVIAEQFENKTWLIRCEHCGRSNDYTYDDFRLAIREWNDEM